ncbi:MAG TPA: hypothetical protein VLQ89_01180 [Candidatus Binatia bacterium]|nr:hypothetical protein [Candidatus Binatia bacterium]
MRFGVLVIFIALLVMLFLYVGKGRQANPVAQGMAALEKTKKVTTEVDMNGIVAAVTAYFGDHDQYPENLDMLVPKYLRSADAVIDSWGTPFQLEKDDQQNLYLLSAGPDRIFASADDTRRRL